jgi:hypothetical protein
LTSPEGLKIAIEAHGAGEGAGMVIAPRTTVAIVAGALSRHGEELSAAGWEAALALLARVPPGDERGGGGEGAGGGSGGDSRSGIRKRRRQRREEARPVKCFVFRLLIFSDRVDFDE